MFFIFLDTPTKINILNAARNGKPTFKTGLFKKSSKNYAGLKK